MADSAQALPHSIVSRFAQRAPVRVFLLLTFAWAWLLWGYWIPAMPAGGLVITPAFMVCAILGGFAPSLAALFTAWLMQGRGGVARLLHGLTHWRAPPQHFALALGIVPGTTLVVTGLLPLLIGPLKPADPSLLAVVAFWPIMAALGEELGWRGFLLPHLLKRYGPVGASFIIGLIWGLWHLPADYVGLKGYGGAFIFAFLINGPFLLTAHALIMGWLWRRTSGNLLMMVIYHWTITASSMLSPGVGSEGVRGLIGSAIGGAAFWVVALLLWLSEARKQAAR